MAKQDLQVPPRGLIIPNLKRGLDTLRGDIRSKYKWQEGCHNSSEPRHVVKESCPDERLGEEIQKPGEGSAGTKVGQLPTTWETRTGENFTRLVTPTIRMFSAESEDTPTRGGSGGRHEQM